MDLRAFDLRGCVLASANFFGAKIDGARFGGADLMDVKCRGVSFRDAELGHAMFSFADLTDCNFQGARFEGEGHLYSCSAARADFRGTDLSECTFHEVELVGATFNSANLRRCDFSECDLRGATFDGADIAKARFSGAHLEKVVLTKLVAFDANFSGAFLMGTAFWESDLRGACFVGAMMTGAFLGGAWLDGAIFDEADLSGAAFDGARLAGARFCGSVMNETLFSHANLTDADLRSAVLHRANLERAILVGTDIRGATLRECRVYGISAWDLKTDPSQSNGRDLIITPAGAPMVQVDEIDVAQFIYLLLHNPNIRRVIETIGRKGVLILGRFVPTQMEVLVGIRDELRRSGYVPYLFDFDRAEARDLRETVLVLAGLSAFVIADLTNPSSAPLELDAIVPQFQIPVVPLIRRGQKVFSMFESLYNAHAETRGGHVLAPLEYESSEHLNGILHEHVIEPAMARAAEINAKKNLPVPVRSVPSSGSAEGNE